MTGSFQHMLVLSIASIVAFIAAELCRSKPIYEELLARSLQSANKMTAVTVKDSGTSLNWQSAAAVLSTDV